jgi:subtilisin family serine protease
LAQPRHCGCGEFGGDQNNFGVTGISPLANVRAISIFGGGQSWGKAITDAANALRGGDVILIELHAAGPRFNFQGRNDQRGYIAVEYWPDAFAAIVYATQVRGVIVIEAAGNGAENLDDPIYTTRPVTFPLSWRNPLTGKPAVWGYRCWRRRAAPGNAWGKPWPRSFTAGFL